MTDFTPGIRGYLQLVKETIDKVSEHEINSVMNLLDQKRLEGKNIFIMGNGGSAATASHFVCDFNKGLSPYYDKRFRFQCLNDNVPMMMAHANDESYEMIFVEPLRNYFNPGDVVIGISGSGNSPNVIRAMEYANNHQGVTVGFSGYDGGKLKKCAQYNVHVPINNMQVVEDLHMMLDHLMMTVMGNKAKEEKGR